MCCRLGSLKSYALNMPERRYSKLTVASTARSHDFLALFFPQRDHFLYPLFSCLCRRNVGTFGFIEIVYDSVIVIRYHAPFLGICELFHTSNCRPKGKTIFEFWWTPCIPVCNGGDGPREVDILHRLGEVGCVRPVP